MSTWNGALVSYATPTDMLEYYDIRTIADYLSDTGVRLGGAPNPTTATVLASTRLQKFLNNAAGIIESAVMRSAHYSLSDLATTLDGVSKELLVGINCWLAMGALWSRRPRKDTPPFGYEMAMKYLEDLANGERIFSLAEVEQASIPSAHVETPAEIWARGMVAQQAFRYFGPTADVNPWWGVPGIGGGFDLSGQEV